jgi:hypothetical protein
LATHLGYRGWSDPILAGGGLRATPMAGHSQRPNKFFWWSGYPQLGVSKKTRESELETKNREIGDPVLVPGFYWVIGNWVKYIFLFLIFS